MFQDPLRRVVLREPAALAQDRDAVADLDRLVDVVGDEDDGLPQLLLEVRLGRRPRRKPQNLVLRLLIDHLLHGPPACALLRPRGGDDGGQPADQVLDIHRTEGRARRPHDTPHHAGHPRAIGRFLAPAGLDRVAAFLGAAAAPSASRAQPATVAERRRRS